MGINLKTAALLAAFIGVLASCSKDDAEVVPEIPTTPPSAGATFTLNGGTGGASAVNSVYIDFSTAKTDSSKRNSWDLSFYNGSAFRVLVNATNGGSVIPTIKTELNSVTIADVTPTDANLTAHLGMGTGWSIVDDIKTGDITKNAMKEVSATDADNKVYVVNPQGGTMASVFSADNLYKIRVLRNGTAGYTLQYAKLSETTSKTIVIAKNADYNFKFVKLSTGAEVIVQPKKAEWDIQWTWSIYYGTQTGVGEFIYGYSDLIYGNHLAGVTAAEVLTSTVTYDNYAVANTTTTTFTPTWDAIGAKWRSTSPATGVKTDRFYVIKDAAGNVYKLRFLSMGAGDGGVRGAPQVEYKLVK